MKKENWYLAIFITLLITMTAIDTLSEIKALAKYNTCILKKESCECAKLVDKPSWCDY